MRLYRVHMTINGGESAGYSWHTDKRKADRAVRQHMRGPDGEDMGDTEGHGATIQPVDVEGRLDKGTVLVLLNRYGTHPDNG